MAQSGIKCDECILEEYKKMSSGKNKPYRYIIFKIAKEGKHFKKVVVDKTGERDKTFEDMKKDLEKKGDDDDDDDSVSRYVAFDLCYHTKGENQLREKIIFLTYVPENAHRTEKMVYSSTEKELKSKLGTATISGSWHYDSYSEIDEKEIVEEMAKKN